MPPRLNLFSVGRSLAIRTRPSRISRQPARFLSVSRRLYVDEKPKSANDEGGLGHVSEEAAEMGDITGETKPDISQGTPIQEIIKRDEESKEKAPEVVKEDMDKKATSDSSDNMVAQDTYKTKEGAPEAVEEDASEQALRDRIRDRLNGRRSDNTVAQETDNLFVQRQLEAVAAGGHAEDVEAVGHKFGLPELPIPPNANLKYRYDPLVKQVTNLMMKDGKLSRAQRNMAFVLNHLRSSPPPTSNSLRPLLPGAPPLHHLPLNPILYVKLAIDSVAPLLKIKQIKGVAGGGASLAIPVPLKLRQRRRAAVMWILDAATKKSDRGSGKYQFAQKVAEEIISVVEGRSAAWEKRLAIHKLATSSRANLSLMSAKTARR